MKKAVFLDKDGTLVKDVPYNVNVERIVLDPHAVSALLLLSSKNYLLVIISNQAGVAKGYFAEKDLVKANDHLVKMLAEQGVHIDAFYYCPHHPEGIIPEYTKQCDCRKPGSGMFLNAADTFNIDTSRSWMIGDILDDVEAGHNAGCRSILYDNGNETEWLLNDKRNPDYMVNDLYTAAQIICGLQHSNKTAYAPGKPNLH
ncbi:MAG: HAD family hydrolase [Chitinophagaceae bacterium]|nr:HAD family hydrolase [Chitinophagaceae bacterium]